MKKKIIISVSVISTICIAIALTVILIFKHEEPSINIIDTILGRDKIYLKYDVQSEKKYDKIIVEINGDLEDEYNNIKEFDFNEEMIYEVSFDSLVFNKEYSLSFSSLRKEELTLIDTISIVPNLGSKDNPFLINNIDDFSTLNTFSTDFYKLENDLDFIDTNMDDLFVKKFNGELDGNNYSLKNISFDSYNQCSIFSELSENGCIKNLNVTNITYNSLRFSDIIVGGLVINNYGTIENVTISNFEFIKTGSSTGTQTIGGLVGVNHSSGIIKNSKVYNSSISINIPISSSIGGLVGVNEGSIDNCEVVDTNIICSYNTSAKYVYDTFYSSSIYIGGFCGTNNSSISNSSTNSNIAFFVLGTKTGGDYNINVTGEEQRPQMLESLIVYISDFCGYSETTITNCTSTTTIIDIENAFIDELYIGIISEQISTLNITIEANTMYTINKEIQYSLTYREEIINDFDEIEYIFTKIR